MNVLIRYSDAIITSPDCITLLLLWFLNYLRNDFLAQVREYSESKPCNVRQFNLHETHASASFCLYMCVGIYAVQEET